MSSRHYDWSDIARDMFEEAELEPLEGDVAALTEDIVGVSDDFDGDMLAARYELERRIGGLSNLESYMLALRAKGPGE